MDPFALVVVTGLAIAGLLWLVGTRVPRGSRWSLFRADPPEYLAARARLRTDAAYGLEDAVHDLLRSQKKVWAVRLVREESGATLTEAAEVVTRCERETGSRG